METVTAAQLGMSSSLYRPLDDAGVKKVADESLRILEKSGVKVYTRRGLAAFKSAGAQVDESERLVRIPRAMMEDAISSNPSSITLYSRDDKTNAELTGNKVHYGTGGTALYVLDPDTGERRQSTVDDVILNARLMDVLENIHVFTINVFPNEIKDKEQIDVNRFFHALDNTAKHVMGGIYSFDGCKKVVKMAETIAGSADKLRARPFVSFITLIISPFKIDKDYGEVTCYLAEQGIPVVVPTEPMCGTTSPVTLASNVLVHTAETLAGIAMVQCVNKGSPAICGSVGSISDMRSMSNLAGAIERAMINAAVSQMSQHFDLPLYSTGGTSDAKEVDIQAAYESAMSDLLVAMSGANYIHDSVGLMEFDMTIGYEKLVMDNEILGMAQRVLKGIEINDDTLATDLIIEKGPAQDFLAEEHTIKYMRDEFYFPRLANREHITNYKKEDSAMARAKNFISEVRNSKPESKLEPGVRKSILESFPEILHK